MLDDRRSFIKKFGMTLGSLIASGALPGCGPKKEGGLSNTRSQVGKPNEPAPTPRGPQWEQLRQCWLNLKSSVNIQSALRESYEALRQDRSPLIVARDTLARKHQAILDALVAKDQLEKLVAQHMQIAFEEAAYHVVRSRATCYMGFPAEYTPRENLLQQAEVLRKIPGDLDPATVAKAQAAITQDMAFFEKLKARPGPATGWSLRDDYKTGNLKASPEALEAARLLTELFLERAD